jgi:dephospho-CoA kinase
MFCVGLTGGIGSGKSAAADVFKALGATIVDTDIIARQLTAAGGIAMPALSAAFGDEIVAADGALDRDRMRTLAFSSPDAKNRLEAILHPLIRTESRRQISDAKGAYVVLVVPLLIETGSYREIVTRIAVVDCEEQTQISRTMARSGLDESTVRAVMRAQASRSTRLAAADDVIRNENGLEELREQIKALDRLYRQLSHGDTHAPEKPAGKSS